MENELISVIIPVYKAEAYLDQCMQGVLAQTYKELEIILVDDGSPDGSGALCDAYAQKDGRIRVIHRKNGGAAAARNTGLDAATGAYIGFVDADDRVEPDMYEKLLAALRSADADLAMCDTYYLWPAGRTDTYASLGREVITARQLYERMELAPDAWRYIVPWNRLHRRALFATLRFREGRICEDEILATEQTSLCRRIALIPDRLYWDICRQNSVMTSPVSLKQLAAVEAFVERYDFYVRQGWQDLAAAVLPKAYTSLWEVLAHVNVRENRAALRPWVRAVAARQARRLDPRAAWLWLAYARKLRAGREG